MWRLRYPFHQFTEPAHNRFIIGGREDQAGKDIGHGWPFGAFFRNVSQHFYAAVLQGRKIVPEAFLRFFCALSKGLLLPQIGFEQQNRGEIPHHLIDLWMHLQTIESRQIQAKMWCFAPVSQYLRIGGEQYGGRREALACGSVFQFAPDGVRYRRFPANEAAMLQALRSDSLRQGRGRRESVDAFKPIVASALIGGALLQALFGQHVISECDGHRFGLVIGVVITLLQFAPE